MKAKKYMLTIGTLTTITMPIVAVVSCKSESKTSDAKSKTSQAMNTGSASVTFEQLFASKSSDSDFTTQIKLAAAGNNEIKKWLHDLFDLNDKPLFDYINEYTKVTSTSHDLINFIVLFFKDTIRNLKNDFSKILSLDSIMTFLNIETTRQFVNILLGGENNQKGIFGDILSIVSSFFDGSSSSFDLNSIMTKLTTSGIPNIMQTMTSFSQPGGLLTQLGAILNDYSIAIPPVLNFVKHTVVDLMSKIREYNVSSFIKSLASEKSLKISQLIDLLNYIPTKPVEDLFDLLDDVFHYGMRSILQIDKTQPQNNQKSLFSTKIENIIESLINKFSENLFYGSLKEASNYLKDFNTSVFSEIVSRNSTLSPSGYVESIRSKIESDDDLELFSKLDEVMGNSISGNAKALLSKPAFFDWIVNDHDGSIDLVNHFVDKDNNHLPTIHITGFKANASASSHSNKIIESRATKDQVVSYGLLIKLCEYLPPSMQRTVMIFGNAPYVTLIKNLFSSIVSNLLTTRFFKLSNEQLASFQGLDKYLNLGTLLEMFVSQTTPFIEKIKEIYDSSIIFDDDAKTKLRDAFLLLNPSSQLGVNDFSPLLPFVKKSLVDLNKDEITNGIKFMQSFFPNANILKTLSGEKIINIIDVFLHGSGLNNDKTNAILKLPVLPIESSDLYDSSLYPVVSSARKRLVAKINSASTKAEVTQFSSAGDVDFDAYVEAINDYKSSTWHDFIKSLYNIKFEFISKIYTNDNQDASVNVKNSEIIEAWGVFVRKLDSLISKGEFIYMDSSAIINMEEYSAFEATLRKYNEIQKYDFYKTKSAIIDTLFNRLSIYSHSMPGNKIDPKIYNVINEIVRKIDSASNVIEALINLTDFAPEFRALVENDL